MSTRKFLVRYKSSRTKTIFADSIRIEGDLVTFRAIRDALPAAWLVAVANMSVISSVIEQKASSVPNAPDKQ